MDRPAFRYIYRFSGSEGRCDRGYVVSDVGIFDDEKSLLIFSSKGL